MNGGGLVSMLGGAASPLRAIYKGFISLCFREGFFFPIATITPGLKMNRLSFGGPTESDRK